MHQISVLNSSSFPLYIHGKDTHNNSHRNSWFLKHCKHSSPRQRKVHRCMKVVMASTSKNTNTITTSQSVKALVTVKQNRGGILGNLLNGGLDGIKDLIGKTLVLQLVSDELDPSKFCFSICFHLFYREVFIFMHIFNYFQLLHLLS